MTSSDGPDERSYDYASELGGVPRWGPLALIAAAAIRIMPPYEVLADAAENAAYHRVVDALWQVREADASTLRGLYDAFLPLWPEDEEEMDDLTAYYWKVRTLHVLKSGMEHAIVDPVRGARIAEQAALDLIDDFDSRIDQEGIERPLAATSQQRTPYSTREFTTFLGDVATLREQSDPEAAVRNIRERSAAEADFLRQELLARWIRAEGWSQADLESAHGANQNGR